MKKRIIQLAQPLLDRCGLRLMRAKDYDKLIGRESLLLEMQHQMFQRESEASDLDLELIVFSMDRALQLHGLLSSMLHHLQGEYSVRVLYRSSTEAHQKAYDEVQSSMADRGTFIWQKESDFRADLIQLLQDGSSSQVAFLVDDIVFIRPLDLTSLRWADYSKGILSLRLGRGIDYCYTKAKKMTEPELASINKRDGTLSFSWRKGEYDWAYPLSVDGHVFPRSEMLVAAEMLRYSAPNSFERALQLLNPLYQKRTGYCFTAPKILNIPLNKVQNENNNISADISPEYLLEQWNKGMMLNYKNLEGVPTNSVHQELDVDFCKRHF